MAQSVHLEQATQTRNKPTQTSVAFVQTDEMDATVASTSVTSASASAATRLSAYVIQVTKEFLEGSTDVS